MKKKKLHIVCWFIAYLLLNGQLLLASDWKLPKYSRIQFIENKGQWNKEVLYRAGIPGGHLFITETGLYYALLDGKALHDNEHNPNNLPIQGHNYKMEFAGGNKHLQIKKGQEFDTYYNYFIGSDPKKWASDCKAYESIILSNVYNGIDAEIIAVNDHIKINFILKPFANPNLIKLAYKGQDKISLTDGALHISTSVANIKEEKPIGFQQKGEVACEFSLQNDTLQFKVGAYNHGLPLIIDPNVIFGTFSGSFSDNFGNSATFDKNGNAWTAGTVYGPDFPVSLGAFQQTFEGGVGSARDVGLLKFSADGKKLLCATFLGGTNNEQPHSIICNNFGDLFVMGTTFSNDFPTQINSYDRTYNGNADIFVTRLQVDGRAINGSTYIGGSDADGINGTNPNSLQYRTNNPLTYNYGDFYRGEIQLDSKENVLVVSCTQSNVTEGFPLRNAFQSGFGGGNQDGCIVKLISTLGDILFSSYLGGTNEDMVYGVTVDKVDNLFICGGSNSNNIGVAQGLRTFNGNVDGFIGKLDAPTSASYTLSKLIYTGTPQYDQAYLIGMDNDENVYVTGQTKGSFVVTPNVYSNTNGKQFISCYSYNLDTLKQSTVIGSGSATPNISPSGFLVDECGRVYLSGWGGITNSSFNPEASTTTNMAVTANAFQKITDGSDFYLIVLGKKLASLDYATYYGGSMSKEHVDGGTSRFDKRGIVYQGVCAGCGGFSDFPTTVGAYSRTNNSSNCNNGIFKMDLNVSSNAPIARDTTLFVVVGNKLIYDFTVFDPDVNDSLTVIFGGSLLTLTPNNATLITNRTKSRVNASLRWEAICNNASTNDTLVLTIEAKDDGCFGPNTTLAKIKVVVIPLSPLTPPYPQCLKTINDSIAQLQWTSILNPKGFKSFQIYRSKNGSPFQLVDTIKSSLVNSYTDFKVPNHLTTDNYCYYLETVNICDSVSLPSRLICSLFQYDTLTTPVFKVTKDTVLYVTATDALTYQFEAFTNDIEDSIYTTVNGNMITENRLKAPILTIGKHVSRYQFSFQSNCDDIGRIDTLSLNFFMRDNQCPQSRTGTAKVKIVVLSPPVYNPPKMRCTRSLDNQSVLVRWEKPTTGKYFSHFVLLKRKLPGNFDTIMRVYSDTAFSFLDKLANNNENIDYCYAAFAVNTCNQNGDTSQPSCTVTKTIDFPDPIYIYTTTVEKNKHILVSWKPSEDPNFLSYAVLKKEKGGANFNRLSTLTQLNDTTFIDEDVEVGKRSYCYELRQKNDCGTENNTAYFACSILLQGDVIPFTNKINWSDYDYFANGLEKYSIYRSGPEENRFLKGETFSKNVRLIDDKLNYDNGLYYYTVNALESNTIYSSVSNTIELVQSPLLYVPNAYTPNNDGVNDTWKTQPVFVKEYNLKLFDRWGKKVFETNNKHESLKDELLNDPINSDVFVYVVTYTGWDNSVHSQKGNVTVLK